MLRVRSTMDRRLVPRVRTVQTMFCLWNADRGGWPLPGVRGIDLRRLVKRGAKSGQPIDLVVARWPLAHSTRLWGFSHASPSQAGAFAKNPG